MSDSPQSIRGIRYEVSKPRRKDGDKYYYQRVRQVDERGNLVGIGEQVLRSADQDSADGLVVPSVDISKVGRATLHALGALLAAGRKNPGGIAKNVTDLAHDFYSGLNQDYRAWPGTETPWERPLDWRTGSAPTDFVQHPVSGAIGDGNGIGRWWDASADFPPRRPPRYDWEVTGEGFANVPLPSLSPSPLKKPAWNDEFVRDSAAAAGIPSRNNVFEFGFPEPGSVRPSLTTPGATLGTGYVGGVVSAPVPFIPEAPPSAPGGIPGLIAAAGLSDPRNPDAPPPGGLVHLIHEYLRDKPR